MELPPAQGRTNHTFEMRTAYRALVGELLGCGLDGAATGDPGGAVPTGDRRPGAALDPDVSPDPRGPVLPSMTN